MVLVPTPQLAIDVPPTITRPSTSFDPAITAGPSPLPLSRQSEVRYTLSTTASWNSATALPFAGNPPGGSGVVSPSIWYFPSALIAAVSAGGGHPYQLVAAPPGQVATDPPPVAAYDWATILPFQIRQVTDPAGIPLRGTAIVNGADQDGRDLLLGLIEYFNGPGQQDNAQLWLLYPADPTSANPDAYVSDALDVALVAADGGLPAATLLLQTNLSTLTSSGVGPLTALAAAAEFPSSGTYYATLGAGAAFIRLLWEASIVGTGGFYLQYQTTTGGGLPAGLFASGSSATMWLVVILGTQSAGSGPARTLFPFMNAAVVRDAIDSGRLNVFAEATDRSDMTTVATVPPGNVGVTLTRKDPGAGTDPESLTQGLFSLLDYEVPAAQNTFFASSLVVLPSGPVNPDTTGDWTFQAVVPIYRLAVDPPAQISPAYPPAASNPYAGIAQGSQVTFGLAFRDVFGNELAANPAVPAVTVPAGYTDPVLGLSSWPNAAGYYTFANSGGVAQLQVAVNLDLARYLPGPSLSVANALQSAATHVVKYRQVWYQVQQPDLQFSIGTSFDEPAAGPTADPAAHQALANFVTSAYVFLDVVTTLQLVRYTTQQAGETPTTVANAFGVSIPQLFESNGSADASLVFTQPLTIPQFHVAKASDTLAGSVSGGLTVAGLLQQNATLPLTEGIALHTAALAYTTQAGDTLQGIANLLGVAVDDIATANAATTGILNTKVSVSLGGVTLPIGTTDTFATLAAAFAARGVTDATPIAIAEANATLADLFLPQVVIEIAQSQTAQGDTSGRRTVQVGTGDGSTADAIVAAQLCTLGGLAAANAQISGLLTAGLQVTVQGATLTIAQGETLAALAGRFLAQNVSVSVADIVAATQTIPNFFASTASLIIPDYVVQRGDTIQSILAVSSAFTIEFLAARNPTAPTGIFLVGTPLYLGSMTEVALPGQTISQTAQANTVTIDQLATANAATAFVVGAVIEVPAAWTFGPAPTAQFVTYGAAAGITLGQIAANWGVPASTIAVQNASVPALFTIGVEIAYAKASITTQAGDTFATLAKRAGAPDVGTFASDPSVTGLAGLIAPDALFVMSLSLVKTTLRDPTTQTWTFGQLATVCNVPLADLANANGALVGFLASGVTYSLSTGQGPALTATTGPNDTLQTLVLRFAAQGATTTAGEIVVQNAGLAGTLNPGSPFLVPPRPASFGIAIAQPFVPGPYFPLRIELNTTRTDPGLIDHDFLNSSAVLGDVTPLAPLPSDAGGGLSLQPLATAFETAFAALSLKLATGPEATGLATTGRPLWVVDLGSTGISRVAVQGGQPLYYAMPPLSTSLESRTDILIPAYDPFNRHARYGEEAEFPGDRPGRLARATPRGNRRVPGAELCRPRILCQPHRVPGRGHREAADRGVPQLDRHPDPPASRVPADGRAARRGAAGALPGDARHARHGPIDRRDHPVPGGRRVALRAALHDRRLRRPGAARRVLPGRHHLDRLGPRRLRGHPRGRRPGDLLRPGPLHDRGRRHPGRHRRSLRGLGREARHGAGRPGRGRGVRGRHRPRSQHRLLHADRRRHLRERGRLAGRRGRRTGRRRPGRARDLPGRQDGQRRRQELYRQDERSPR